MFNECLIHLCDCTWLNVLHLLNHMLIKHKKIFEYFNCFWKVFLFWKFSKFQILCNSILATYSRGSIQSRDPNWELTQKLSWFSGELSPQSWKRLKKFSNFVGFRIFATHLTTGSQVEALITSLLKMLHNSHHDLLASGPSSRKKQLEKFFKFCHIGFWRLDLVTCSQLILVAKNTCFAQIGLNPRQFS